MEKAARDERNCSMTKKIGIIAALACAFVLCFALVGCGGSIDKTKFIGSWGLESSSDEDLDADSIELMKSLGLEVTLTLNEDGTGSLDLFGTEMGLKWDATSDTEGTLTLEDEQGSANLKIDGDALTLSDSSDTTMTFAKKS